MCLNPQSGQTLCDPTDCSPPSSFVHGIFQVRMLEWVAVSYSGGSSQPRDLTHFHSFLSGFITLTESHLIIGSQGFSPCRALQGLRAIVVAHEVCVFRSPQALVPPAHSSTDVLTQAIFLPSCPPRRMYYQDLANLWVLSLLKFQKSSCVFIFPQV